MAPVRCKLTTLPARLAAEDYYYSFGSEDHMYEQKQAGKRGVLAVMRAVLRERGAL